jgi:hypothetical protein
MANFPDLAPSIRTYMPGAFASTQLRTLLGEEASVQHNNSIMSHRLIMTFNAISNSDQTLIYNHYLLHGRFTPFELDSNTIDGSNLTFPANHKWIYARSPQVEKTCSVTSMNVELELIPDYTI